MKKLILGLLLWPIISNAQFTDTFNDGNYTTNPTWFGDTAKFEINVSSQLHLNAPAISETAYLSTESRAIINAEWEFYLKMEFNPSSGNFANIYLVSDQSDLNSPLNGYFVKIGNTDDEISLYKQSGSSSTKIIDGKDDRVNSSLVNLSVKVTRDSLGNWELLSDTLGGTNYYPEGSTLDNDYSETNYFGVLCDYTSTRSTKFYFDDFKISGSYFVDSIPPTIKSYNLLSNNSIEIIFSETLEEASVLNPNNYMANCDIGEVDSIIISGEKVILYFYKNFPDGETCELTVENIKDNNGNTMIPKIITFCHYSPKTYDIVINEIMADPSPSIGLPETEYIELFNISSYPIDLTNWIIETATSSKVISVCELLPDDYLILSSKEFCNEFSGNGLTYCFESFPALANAGTSITLKDNNGMIISSVNYSLNWYQNEYKSEGGWSLEQIDPFNPCGGINNWRASKDIRGGSPGEQNSIFANNPDIIPPELERAAVVNDSTLILFFSESLDRSSSIDPTKYLIDYQIGNPSSIELIAPAHNSLLLHLNKNIEPEIIYEISIANTIVDCSGNEISEINFAIFAIPELPEKSDIIINEILFDPEPGCVDFVEIYNRSNKTIDLINLLIGTVDEISNEPKSFIPITESNYLLFPTEYIVLSINPTIITDFYYSSNSKGFIEMKNLPTFSNEKGTVLIMDKWLNSIDSLHYENKMHLELINNTEGVSLERIHFDRPTNDKSNWHSAAESVGYATPAYLNSQFSNLNNEEKIIAIEPEIFSPDNDGYNDVVTISISMENPGWMGNIFIFNVNGQLEKKLINNELIGTKSNFSWDGINEYGYKSIIGIYIIYIELYNTTGEVRKYKRTCTLGAKL